MDVLIFDCEAYTLTISTASIDAAWTRFERRVNEEAMSYCDYRSSCEGLLSLNKRQGEKKGMERQNEEPCKEWKGLWPVMFETCEYQFAVAFKSVNDAYDKKNEPFVRHQMKSVGEGFHFYPNSEHSGILVGTINFLNSPGKFLFAFEYIDAEGNTRQESLELYVASPKLDTKNDLAQIMALIHQEYENYVFEYLTLTFSSFALDRSERNNKIIWLSIFKSVVDEYFGNVKFIMSRPNNKPIRRTLYSHPEKIRRWTPQEEERYKSMGSDAERQYYRHELIENTVNTRENRFVKYSLHVLGKKFNEVFGEMRGLYADMDDNEKVLLDSYSKTFRKLESDAFFKKVGSFEGFRQESAVLQQRTGYSQIYKAWLMLKNSLELVDGKTDIGVKKIWELYEIWCFLVMKRLIAKVLDIDLDNPEGHIREDKSEMLNTIVQSGMAHCIEYDNVKNGDIVRLEYQHTYSRRTDEFKTMTTEQRPDIVVTIERGNKFVLTYLYDAKYRVQDDQTDAEIDEGVDIDMADYPVVDAINQMHRYRDAIYYAMKADERPQGKEVIGGYILFPGRTMGDAIKDRYFYKSIKSVNIGAFPLLPAGKDHGGDLVECDLLEQHLREILVENSTYEQLKDSVPQKGLHYSLRPEDKDSLVLVGYARKGDKERFLANKMYYVRAEFESGSLRLRPGFEWARYLLLHDANNTTREVYELDEKGPRVVSKESLRKLGFTPEHDWYMVFDILDSKPIIMFDKDIPLQYVKKKYNPYFITLSEMMTHDLSE